MVFDPSKVNGANGSIPDDQPGGKYGYRIGHKKGEYQIPDVILDECSKHVKVVTIGAGISGIFLSYLFQKLGENLEHVVYEKNGEIGGTWLEVRKRYTYKSVSQVLWANANHRTDTLGRHATSHRMLTHSPLPCIPTGQST